MKSTAALAAACVAAGVLAACSSQSPAGSTAASAPPRASVSLATSLSTAGNSWALVPMSANPAFWQVFARPAASTAWQLVTPPNVASNGGLVAAGTGGSLTVAFRPSQSLTFSPLATSTDGGARWSTGLIDASVAATPGALAASGSQMVALLGDGTILASSDSGGSWRTLARPGAVAGSPAGKQCGVTTVNEVSFGITDGEVLAAGTCGTASTGLFAYSRGGWSHVSLPVSGRIVAMMPDQVLVASGTRLQVAWDTASGWTVSAPLAGGNVVASGSLAAGAAWVLLPGRQAATIAGPGQQWRALPAVPQGTAVLAAGPAGAVDALTVSGSKLTVWRLGGAATAWSKIQTIDVPVQAGSSS